MVNVLSLLHIKHCSGHKINKNHTGMDCATHKEWRKAYRILVRKSKKTEHVEDLGVHGSDIKT